MGVRQRLIRSTERLDARIDRLRAKGGSRRELKAAKLDLKAELNRIVLRDWNDERWG